MLQQFVITFLSFENSFCLHNLKHFQVSFKNKSFMNIVKSIFACCSPTTFIFFNVVVAMFDVVQMCALVTPFLPTSQGQHLMMVVFDLCFKGVIFMASMLIISMELFLTNQPTMFENKILSFWMFHLIRLQGLVVDVSWSTFEQFLL